MVRAVDGNQEVTWLQIKAASHFNMPTLVWRQWHTCNFYSLGTHSTT